MNADAVVLIESILVDAQKLEKDLKKLSELRPDDPKLMEMIARAEENAALLRCVREAVEGEGDVLELY